MRRLMWWLLASDQTFGAPVRLIVLAAVVIGVLVGWASAPWVLVAGR